jgi:hypothetical protein
LPHIGKRWWWFAPIGDRTVKSTNLHAFYSLGIALERMSTNIGVDKTRAETIIYVIEPYNLLMEFLAITEEMPLSDTRGAATYLYTFVNTFYKSVAQYPEMAEKYVTQNEVSMFLNGKDQFEKAFEREYRNLDVFTVMQKGIYETRSLMTAPEKELPDRLRKFLPKQTLDDWKEAGRCLAFEVPTACAFHICRGTEALILAYYEKLAKEPWPLPKNRDWYSYVDHLRMKGSPPTLVTRLQEIRDMDRNAYAHPDKTVTLDEAPVLFRLCTGVTFYMCEEIAKLP